MAELIISERKAGEVTILDMSGDVIFGEGNVALRRTIRSLLDTGKKNILLNFSGVRFVDSSGVGELVSALMAINRVDGQLKLLSLSKRIRELLAITNLLTIFDTFENEIEAVNSYK
jgi:anti-sigma B factor antagonist